MTRSIYLIVIFAFIFRLGLGVAASVMLPQIGYESKPQQAGYLFFDAFRRDTQAWDLAQSSKSLISAFSGKYSSDQYGGLLWISAFVYRYFFNASAGNMATGGSHQPIMIILLAALVGSLGVPFVYLSGKRITGDANNKTGLYAALIFAFFPEAILLGASQMREPFLMTFIAMAFYGLIEWQATRRKKTLDLDHFRIIRDAAHIARLCSCYTRRVSRLDLFQQFHRAENGQKNPLAACNWGAGSAYPGAACANSQLEFPGLSQRQWLFRYHRKLGTRHNSLECISIGAQFWHRPGSIPDTPSHPGFSICGGLWCPSTGSTRRLV